MSEKKDEQLLIRLSGYEAARAAYIAKISGLSRAEVFRLGLRIIAQGSAPTSVRELGKFYADRGGGNNE